MSRACLAALLPLVALLSCGSPEVRTEIIDRPATEEAFPARPLPFELPKGPFALVSNNASDTISVLDLTLRTRVGDLRAGLNPVDNDGPHHLAFHRERGEVFVALAYPAPALSPGPHAAHGSAAVPGKVARLSLPGFHISGVMRADPNPGDIVLSDDGSRLVVSHYDLQRAIANATLGVDAQRATLLVYDPARFGETESPRAISTCVTPHGVALSRPDGRFAFVACNGEDAIAVVDLADASAPILRVPVGPSPGTVAAPRYGPYAAVLSPDGKRVLVGTTEARDLRVFDVEARAMTGQAYAAGGAAYFAAADAQGKVAYVPVQSPDFIARVDLSSPDMPELTRRNFTKQECQLPHEAMLRNNDTELFLVCEGDHVAPGKILVLDPLTLDTIASIDVGAYPDKIIMVEP